MSKNGKNTPPSRQKYDEANPVVSFRVSKELFDRLEAVKRAEGKSNADVLAVGVGLVELKTGKEKEIRQKAYDEGWEKGNEEAYDLYAVTYPCYNCKKEITVDSDEEKTALRKFLTANRWHHTDCDDPLN